MANTSGLHEKLEGRENFASWKFAMQTLLESEDLWDLREIGIDISEEMVGALLLSGLPEYKPKIMGLENSGLAITEDTLKIKLLQEVKMVNEIKEEAEKTAMYSKAKQFENRNKDVLRTFLVLLCYLGGWYLDSYATSHMSQRSDWMSNKETYEASVLTANNEKVEVLGKGSIAIKNGTDTEVIKVEDDAANKVVARGLREGVTRSRHSMKKQWSLRKINLWHRRLGHLNRKGMCILKSNSETGLAKMSVSEQSYKTCVLALVEKQSGCEIKALRTDNGKEYVNQVFANFMKSEGIRHQTTIAYNPQQNGLAERMNRTIVEKARTMLLEARLDKKYWAEATSTSVYLINRSPSTPLNGKSPEAVWSGSQPKLKHLRVFGCVVAYTERKEG
ncbi:uncharacterized protein LOC113562008 [Ooceraea biroi]|uniref:uncharacterized protein LOC113562008 n=1 Tax=Ooceraea biroi TaxID=2015173 RepID=UPI000F0876F9|nr:uncharacterized protein LOC113562008 [Ooceraea biroi]